MSRPTDHAQPLPDTVITRCAGTNPATYCAHGAYAAGANELAASNAAASLRELADDMKASYQAWQLGQKGKTRRAR